MSPQWLRMGEAMSRLGVSRKTLRKYCVQGLVRAEKLPPGGESAHWRIDAESLDGILGGFQNEVLAHLKRLRL